MALDLRLPDSLISEVIRNHPGKSINAEYFFALARNTPPDLHLPTPPRKSSKKQVRYSLAGVLGGRYLASSEKTALFESWDLSNRGWRADVWKVRLEVHRMFDLRPPDIQRKLELGSRECFQLALPPDARLRQYPAWQYVAYAVWSAGFTGIIWKSQRSPGDSLWLYSQGPKGRIGTPVCTMKDIDVGNWLKRNP